MAAPSLWYYWWYYRQNLSTMLSGWRGSWTSLEPLCSNRVSKGTIHPRQYLAVEGGQPVPWNQSYDWATETARGHLRAGYLRAGHLRAGYLRAGHLRAGHLRERTFEREDIWERGHLRERTFERADIWERGHLRERTFESGDIWELGYLRAGHLREFLFIYHKRLFNKVLNCHVYFMRNGT